MFARIKVGDRVSFRIEKVTYTVNVDIFTLYIFSRNSRFLNIRENMYTHRILIHLKLPIFINPRKLIHAKISTFTAYDFII